MRARERSKREMREARESHVEWLVYWEGHAKCPADNGCHCHAERERFHSDHDPVEYERRWVNNYDRVLRVLAGATA